MWHLSSSGCFAQYWSTQALLLGSTILLEQSGGRPGAYTCPEPGPGFGFGLTGTVADPGPGIEAFEPRPEPTPGRRTSANCTLCLVESTTSILSLKPVALSRTVRVSPLLTGSTSGPSNSLLPFS